MQIINILRNDQQFARPLFIQRRQRAMRWVWLNFMQFRPTLIIKAVHKRSIAGERLWRADILDAMPFPKTFRPAKGGKAAFGGNASSCQDNDVVDVLHALNLSPRMISPQASLEMTRPGRSGIGQMHI